MGKGKQLQDKTAMEKKEMGGDYLTHSDKFGDEAGGVDRKEKEGGSCNKFPNLSARRKGRLFL